MMARILGPGEYGIAAVVIVFSSVSGLLRDSGIAAFVVQRFQISSRVVSSLHYISCGLGILLGIVMAAIGPLLASNYDDGRYVEFAVVMAMNFVFCGLSAVPTALLSRNMNFRILAGIDVFTVVVACTAGVVMAMAGHGAWALVVQATALTAVQSISAVLICPWRPGIPARWREIRRALVFSSNVSVVQSLHYVSANIDNLLVASFFGTRAAGLYAQAFQLLVLPLQQINGPLQRVFIPTLSRLTREPGRFRKFFRAIISVVGFTLWPIFAILFVFADSIVLNLFGEEWTESSSIFRILVAVGISQSIGYVTTWLFIATGQVRRQRIWTLCSKPFVVASFFVGIPWGVQTMVASYAIACALVVVPEFLIASRRLELSFRDLVSPMLLPATVALAALAFASATHFVLPPAGNLAMLCVDLFVVGVAIILFACVVAPVRRRVLELMSQVTGRM